MADKQIIANNERQQHQRRRRRQPQPPPLPPQQPQQPQVQPPQPPQQPPEQPPQPPQQPPVPLPYPGFRFDPYDHELIKYYLEYKINGNDLRSSPIKEVNIYGRHPRKLTKKYQPQGKDDLWYFFTTREKKYMFGNRPARNAGNNGFWKCTGAHKKITDDFDENKVIGLRKHLKYYEGRQVDVKNQKKTEWMMHEYQILDQAESSKAKTEELKRKRKASTSMRLDIVLCKIYYKKKAAGKKPADKKTVQVTDMDAAGNLPESSRRAGQVKKKKAATRNRTPRVNNSAAKDKGKGKAKVKADEIELPLASEMNHSNQDSDHNTSSYDSANSSS